LPSSRLVARCHVAVPDQVVVTPKALSSPLKLPEIRVTAQVGLTIGCSQAERATPAVEVASTVSTSTPASGEVTV
jgi:hypothetical protein